MFLTRPRVHAHNYGTIQIAIRQKLDQIHVDPGLNFSQQPMDVPLYYAKGGVKDP
jgi:hypothetical protein